MANCVLRAGNTNPEHVKSSLSSYQVLQVMGSCCCLCQCPKTSSSKPDVSNKGTMPGTLSLNRPKLHNRPIIGMMTVVADNSPLGRYVLPAAYVKSVEASGGRVVPVYPGQPEVYYRKLFEKLNGLFIPGGAGSPTGLQKPVTEAVSLFYRWSIEAYDQSKSVYWPIWGTCLGLETLLDITEGMTGKLLTQCAMPPKSYPLNLTNEGKTTRLISSLPEDLLEAISDQPVLPHLHSYCITVDNFKAKHLDDFYTLIGTNRDRDGVVYVSAIEARNGYPIYALMGHPEKTIYSWTKRFDYDRSLEGIRLAQHFMNFFVQECCKNDNQFANAEDEKANLIFNFNPIYTAKEVPGSITDQSYYFF